MSATLLEAYLTELARALRKHWVFESRIIEEARGHLVDAAEDARQRGLNLEAAEREAIERFGAAGTIAVKFAEEKHRILNRVLLVVAVAFGMAIAYVDSSPQWDDAGITAFSMLLGAGLLGLIGPQRPWLWALGIGIWIPLHGIIQMRTHGSFVGGLVILAFPTVGAYLAVGFRRMLAMV